MATRLSDTKRRPSISAVLPAYNEEANVEGAVLDVAEVLKTLTDDFEVVVTNDGSRDRTGEVLERVAVEHPEVHLRVVTHPRNLGYGAALASGFGAARMDLIFFTDGDKQFDVRELAKLLAALDDWTDLAVGWREHRADPPVRLLNAWLWKQAVNAIFGYTARDVDCAFKLFRREVWESFGVRSRGATFSAEFLIKARRLGFRIREVPVSHYPRQAGSPTGAKPKVIVRALRDLILLRRNLDRELASDSREILRRRDRPARPIKVWSGSPATSWPSEERP